MEIFTPGTSIANIINYLLMLIVNIFVDSKYIISPGGYVNFIDNLRIWIQVHPSGAYGIFLTILFIILLVVIRIEYTYSSKKN